MRITYSNSAGKKFDLIAGNFVKIKTANFHNWAFTAQATALQYGEHKQMFKKAALQYQVELYVTGQKWERESFLRALHEAASYDVFSDKQGVLQWGEWKLDCNIISSSTFPHDSRPNTTVNQIVVYAQRPFWYTVDEISIVAPEIDDSATGLDYPHEYSFDYAVSTDHTTTVKAQHYMKSEFIMTITGYASNPNVMINGHPYQVYTEVPADARLTIDSKNKTVIITYPSGQTINVFNNRRKDYSIFEPIPSGDLRVRKSGDFDAVLGLVYERNEPTLWI